MGVVLFINQSHYVHIRYASGGGANNRVEFVSLWTLLEVAKRKDLRKLQVLGDSKLVIDWAQGKVNVQNTKLANVLREIKLAFQSFKWLSFHHVLRELNSKANELSEEALELQKRAFEFYEYFEGIETKAMKLWL